MKRRSGFWVAFWIMAAAIVGGTLTFLASRSEFYGPGAAGGPFTSGCGMGPAMMWRYGPGGFASMGPGMMYGRGDGYGFGMGPGSMGRYGCGASPVGLGLTQDQMRQIGSIRSDFIGKVYPLLQQMQQQGIGMRQAYFSGNTNPVELKNTYAKIQDLQKQVFDARIDAQARQDAVLTREQRGQLRRLRGNCSMTGDGSAGF